MTVGIRFEASTADVVSTRADLLVVPVFEGAALNAEAAQVGERLEIDLQDILRRNQFQGRRGNVHLVDGFGRLPARSLLLIGVGREDQSDESAVRDAAMRAGSSAHPYAIVASTLPRLGSSPASSAAAFVEGFLLGAYRFDRHKTDRAPSEIRTVRLLVPMSDRGAARAGAERGRIVGLATNRARDLVNAPASEATPAAIAEAARSEARRLGVSCKVWTRAALERGGFGGILGVGAGSANDPRLVELSYSGAGRGRPIAVTGKGVTFDSGGLNVKKPAEMRWMRSDMAGGAAALATVFAAAELGLKANVIAAVPFAENMSGSAAIKPGDVVRHRGGRTSEVLDTDAEGRVMLADALVYLSEKRPAAILDSATLTDASGLGPDLWAGMGTDSDLMKDLVDAGREAGEPGWEIPLWSPYRRLIDSNVADVKNLADHGFDSAMLAGLFLRDFVDDGVPWVHVDTGSSAWSEHATDLWPEGATGSPVRTFVRLIERRADRGRG